MKVLHPFSGGIDSTSVLLQLVEQGHDVTTLHVDIAYGRNVRWKAERLAVANVLKWFEGHGHAIRHLDGGRLEMTGQWWDIEMVGLIAGNHLLGDRTIEATTCSTSLDDTRLPGWASRNMNRCTVTEIIGRRRPTWLKPNVGKTRQQVIAELPPDLLALTAFCRNPAQDGEGYGPCGKCSTCHATLKYLGGDHEFVSEDVRGARRADGDRLGAGVGPHRVPDQA